MQPKWGTMIAGMALFCHPVVAPAGETQTFQYDDLGRLITVQHSGGPNGVRLNSWCFDPAGNRRSNKSDGSGSSLNCPIIPPQQGPTYTISDASVSEGGALSFTITQSFAATQTLYVAWSTSSGSAIEGKDFAAGQGTLTFAAGQQTKTVTVQTTDDPYFEPDETLFVTLIGARNAAGEIPVGTGTIINNDTPNNPPIANTDSATVKGGEQVIIDVVANDTDNDNDSLTVTSVGTPSTGSVNVYGSTQVIYYAGCTAGGTGFSYTITDSRGGTATGWVNVQVNSKWGCL